MTAPVSSRHLADLMAARDSSLPLAAAALARVADEAGRATFSELAIAYREEFLTLRAHSRDAGLPELEGLSVEEFRTSLRTSVLTRRPSRSRSRPGERSPPTAPPAPIGCSTPRSVRSPGPSR